MDAARHAGNVRVGSTAIHQAFNRTDKPDMSGPHRHPTPPVTERQDKPREKQRCIGSVPERRRRHWNDAPLSMKLTLLVAASVALGSLVGVVQSRMEAGLAPLLLGLTLGAAAMAVLGMHWITAPLEQLVHQAHRLAAENKPRSIQRLPGDRADEIGQIARAVQRICVHAIENHHEAKQLRRTLDHRIAEATQRATNQLKRMTQRDPLTDLGNRRFLDEQLDPLAQVVRGTGEDLACVMIDLDNFKQVNDTLGHAAGDELLVLLGSLLQASTRDDDLACRLGGDEFAVFMPGVSEERLHSFTQQLTRHFRQQVRAMHTGGPFADLSIGIATMKRDHCDTGQKLLDTADAKLYQAKRSGKGRIAGLGDTPIAASPPEPVA